MYKKPITYSIHIAVIAICLFATLALRTQYWVPICIVGALIHIYFRTEYRGLYYKKAEEITSEIIKVGPEIIKENDKDGW